MPLILARLIYYLNADWIMNIIGLRTLNAAYLRTVLIVSELPNDLERMAFYRGAAVIRVSQQRNLLVYASCLY